MIPKKIRRKLHIENVEYIYSFVRIFEGECLINIYDSNNKLHRVWIKGEPTPSNIKSFIINSKIKFLIL